MRRTLLRLSLLLPAALIALSFAVPAMAQDGHGEEAETGAVDEVSGGTTGDVKTVVLWSSAGIAAGAVILSVLYLFKRRIGAFPANPSWTAPITILRSKDAPDEGFYGEADSHATHPDGAHGH